MGAARTAVHMFDPRQSRGAASLAVFRSHFVHQGASCRGAGGASCSTRASSARRGAARARVCVSAPTTAPRSLRRYFRCGGVLVRFVSVGSHAFTSSTASDPAKGRAPRLFRRAPAPWTGAPAGVHRRRGPDLRPWPASGHRLGRTDRFPWARRGITLCVQGRWHRAGRCSSLRPRANRRGVGPSRVDMLAEEPAQGRPR